MFRSEKITFVQVIGLVIGFIGALFIFAVWNGIGDNPWWAMLALLAATMCYGIAYPYSKKYILPYGLKTEVLVTTQLCFSAITLLPLFLYSVLSKRRRRCGKLVQQFVSASSVAASHSYGT